CGRRAVAVCSRRWTRCSRRTSSPRCGEQAFSWRVFHAVRRTIMDSHRMRRFIPLLLPLVLMAAPKTVATLAGTGAAGFSGDGGPGIAGQINNPYGLVVGPDGALYFCEIGNHRVRRLDLKTHQLSTVAGTGTKGYA